jgi:outer membrane protein TolC
MDTRRFSAHGTRSKARRRCSACMLAVFATMSLVAQPALADNVPLPQSRPKSPKPQSRPKSPTMPTATSLPRSARPATSDVSLSLADAIFLGLRGNRAIKSAHIVRIAEKFDLRVAEDAFTPHFGIAGETARNRIAGVHSTTIDVSPGVTALTPTGATFDFSWNTSATDTDGRRTASSAADISVVQPLLRGAGIDVNLAPVRSARLGELIARLRLKATVSETVGQIIFAHRDLLLAQEELKLAEAAVARAQNLLAINRALIAAGRMASVEAVQTEADVESQRLRVLRARQQVEAARLALANLLALDLGTPLVAGESLRPAAVTLKLPSLMATALARRPDYMGQVHVVEQNRLGITVAQNEQLWDLAVFARGRFGREYADILPSRSISDITVGLRFDGPINDLRPKQRLVHATTGLQGAEIHLIDIRQGIEMQIRGSMSEINTLWQQLAIAEKARDLANRAVEIEKDKLNAGRSRTLQVRQLEDSLREAERSLLSAKIGYLNALTRLDLQLGTTLETWKVDLKDSP